MNIHEKNTKRMIAFSLALLVVTGLVAVSWKIKRVQALDNNSNKAIVNQRMGRTTLRASSRDNPFVNLSDGRELPIDLSRTAQLQQAFDNDRATALALASADFDEDGMPDLISGYNATGRGFVTLHRGNVDSIFPNSADAARRRMTGEYTDSPFFAASLALELPEPANFLGAGDFDADGHWDLVAAAASGHGLYLLRGDGHGALAAARSVELPGRVTALVTGEINRADGLTDIIVAVRAESGPKLLVLEGPEGALRSKPEEFSLPAEATSLALGQLDDDYPIDLAVGAGSELLIVHGRDRKLSLDETRQAEVPKTVINHLSFPFVVVSMAVGDFTGDNRDEIAMLADDGTLRLVKARRSAKGKKWESELLSTDRLSSATRLIRARVSGLPHHDLLALNESGNQLRILTSDMRDRASSVAMSSRYHLAASVDAESEIVAVLPLRLNNDARDGLVVLNRGSASPSVLSAQAVMTFVVTTTADSGPGSLRQAILDANLNPGTDAISFSIPGAVPHTILPTSALPTITDPVTIDGTTQPGFATTPVIELNFSGAGQSGGALRISAGSTTVRGLVVNRSNSIGINILNNGNNIIENNFIGTDTSGTVGLGNSTTGILVDSGSGNRIGGTSAGARNLISGNSEAGVLLAPAATGNLVQGNLMGTDVNGTAPLGNVLGVNIGGPNNTIGGTAAGARNVISKNIADGILIQDGSGNLMQGNFIGTNASGNADLGNNQDGVFIGNRATNNTVGGTTAAARNIISGNDSGVHMLFNSATGNLVQGNFIGTDVSGAVDLGNSFAGVLISDGISNTVGGTSAGARNVISGNDGHGVAIATDATANQVQGNFIGTDPSGTIPLSNSGSGVVIDRASGNDIGGATAAARNIISANESSGVLITGNSSTGNRVQGNFIGADISGVAPLGNAASGVRIDQASSGNITRGNRIAFNQTDGVTVVSGQGSSVRNSIVRNTIFSNGRMGIDLNADGPTLNDPGDPDTGPNNLQNFPMLTSVSSSGGGTTVQGTLNSTPGTPFTIEFFSNDACDSSGFGEGQSFIGSTMVTTDASCNTSFNATFATPTSAGQVVTATATDPAGNTSEFSECKPVVSGNQRPLAVCHDVTVSAGTGCTADASIDNGSSDPDGDTITTTQSPQGPYVPGATSVTLTVTDSNGASSDCTATVTVVDTTPPAITCPANFLVTAPLGQSSSAVTYSAPTAIDNCSTAAADCSPPSGSSFPLGATTVACTATDGSNNAANCSFTVTVSPPQLTALGSAKAWLGLRNSDDVGTKFDLLAELFKNGAPVGWGELDNVPGGSSGFNNAVLRTINLALTAPVHIFPSDTLSFRLSVRIAATSGHRSGTARLWFNDAAANSNFDATIGSVTRSYYLTSGSFLSLMPGPGPKNKSDVFVDRAVGGSPFKPFGTWSVTF